MSWNLLVRTLHVVGESKPAKPHRWMPPNNRPKGEICQGSATDAVSAWLLNKHPLAWWTRQQIVIGVDKGQKAVDWALIFLRSTGRVEICQDARNPRYRRYRAIRSKDL